MKTLVAMPCMYKVDIPFFRSVLNLRLGENIDFAITEATLIYDARNLLAKKAVEGGYDRVLFLDSDHEFEPDLFERLSADMDTGLEFVTGLYFTRKKPITPVIYSLLDYQPAEGQGLMPVAKAIMDYPKDSLFEIAGSGFGGCLVDVGLIRKVMSRFGMPFSPMPGFGEDLSFCIRATQTGAKLWCDSSIKLGHIMTTMMTEEVYEHGRVQERTAKETGLV